MNIVIAYSLFQLSFASLQSCQKLLANLVFTAYVEGFDKLLAETAPYLQYSGKGDAEFGLYEQCLRKNYEYSSFIITSPHGQQNIGICHSTECTSDDLNSDQMKKTLKDFLDKSGIAKKYNIDLALYDYTAINTQVPIYKITPGFVVTLLIIVLLVLFSLALPFAQLTFNFKTRKQRYKVIYSQHTNIQESQIEDEEEQENFKASLKFQPKDSTFIRMLKDFSIVENWNQLCKLQIQDPNLTIFDGIRSVAFMMVVFGHQFAVTASISSKLDLGEIFNSWLALNLFNMMYSVDIFFWIGGFFIGFVLCDTKKIQQIQKKPSAIFLIILHRLLRIWPCYIFTIMLHTYVAPHVGEGPRWFLTEQGFECKTWWRNIIFIDNWFNDGFYCLTWSWYLSTDIQMFMASLIPLFIYVMYSKVIGKSIVIIVLILTQIIGTIVSYHFQFMIPGFAMFDPNQMQWYYFKPYCRAPPYFLGLLLGIMYREFKTYSSKHNVGDSAPFLYSIKGWVNEVRIRRIIMRIICYLVGFGIMLTLWFAWRIPQTKEDKNYWPQSFQSFYYASCRLSFTIGLSFVTLPNLLGMSDTFNTTIMSCKAFKFMAKVSFTGYLVHYIFIIISSAAFYQSSHFNIQTAFTFFFADLGLTLVSAILMTLLIEMPFGKLEQRLMSQLSGGKKNIVNPPDLSAQLLKL